MVPSDALTISEIRAKLRALSEDAGGQDALAQQIGTSRELVNRVLRGRQLPGPTVLDFLGYERTMVYVPKKPKAKGGPREPSVHTWRNQPLPQLAAPMKRGRKPKLR